MRNFYASFAYIGIEPVIQCHANVSANLGRVILFVKEVQKPVVI